MQGGAGTVCYNETNDAGPTDSLVAKSTKDKIQPPTNDRDYAIYMISNSNVSLLMLVGPPNATK